MPRTPNRVIETKVMDKERAKANPKKNSLQNIDAMMAMKEPANRC